jgi:hypothetical protein
MLGGWSSSRASKGIGMDRGVIGSTVCNTNPWWMEMPGAGCGRTALVAVCILLGLLMPSHAQASAWAVQSTSTPAAAAPSGLSAVSCVSVNLCLAVGDAGGSPGSSVAGMNGFAETWNGQEWSAGPIAAVVRGTPTLQSISCTSSSFCVAAGAAALTGQRSTGLVESWDGTSWQVVASVVPPASGPGRPSFEFSGVSCASVRFCVAVGSYQARFHSTASRTWVEAPRALVERWNGSDWQILPSSVLPGVQYATFAAVSCTDATSCTAVGAYFPGGAGTASFNGSVPLAERWNGRRWVRQHVPVLPQAAPSGSVYVQFNGISCASRTDCMAVGSGNGDQGTGRPVAAQWNGRRWTSTPLAIGSVDGGRALAVSCTSVTACTLVGTSSPRAYRPRGGLAVSWHTELLAQQWDGRRWTPQAVAQVTTVRCGFVGPSCNSTPAFDGVSCLDGSGCVAVGDRVVAADSATLAESGLPATPSAIA